MKTAIKYFWPFYRFRIEGQKLGPILVTKLSKYVNNKSLAPFFIFFNEKRIEKDSVDF